METNTVDKNTVSNHLKSSTQEVLTHLYSRRAAVDQLIQSLEAYQTCLVADGRQP